MSILHPKKLDTIFKQEIAKYRYKPNWEFFANPYNELIIPPIMDNHGT
jgi:hypothetical protein